jgi:hypothetical protein
MPEDEDVDDVLKELLTEIEAARAAEQADQARSERITGLLIRVRQETDMSLPDIEAAIGRYYDRATISRKTSGQIERGRPRRRKPPRS